jgi:nitroreductase
MSFKDLVLKNRSIRRFHEEVAIPRSVLEELVDLARLSASAANRQPLKYLLSSEAIENEAIFPHLAWAGYLKGWPGPGPGERPSAYVVVLGDKEIAQDVGCDHGIASQTILLGAAEKGLAGCMIGAINREGLRKALDIPDRFDILLVLALGKPKETVVVEAMSEGQVQYWRDENQVHHVPKRSLEEIILR